MVRGGGDGGGVVAHQLHTSSTLRDYIMWAWPNDSTRAVRRSVARTGPALSLLTMPDAFISCGCFLVGGLGGGCVDGGKKMAAVMMLV